MSYKLFHKYPVKINNEVTFDISDPDDIKEKYANFMKWYGPIAMCEGFGVVGYLIMITISLFFAYATREDISEEQYEPEGNEVNTRSTQEPLNIIYGRCRIAGNDIYGSTGGDNVEDLYLIEAIGEGPIEGIYQEESVDQVFVDDKIYTEFDDNVSYTLYTGTSGQSYDTDLNTFDSNWTDNLHYTSYIAWKFIWDQDKFRSIPKRQSIIKGLKVQDFRTPSAAPAWSDNAVICLHNFFTSSRYGTNIDSDLIDIASWTVAANYVDTKGWSFNRCIKGNEQGPWDIIKMILRHFHGSLQWFNGKYYLYVADLNEESAVMTIEDEHIVQDGQGKASIYIDQPSIFSTPNGLRITYIDKDLDYVKNDIVFGEVDGTVAEMKLLGCTSRDELGDHAFYHLERLKLNRILRGVFTDECLNLQPHDLVTFNSTALGIEDQIMRVMSVTLQANGLIGLVLQYEDEDLYNNTYDLNIDEIYNTSFPDPNLNSTITNPSIEEELYHYNGKYFSRLNINFTGQTDSNPWFKHCEVWNYITSGSTPPSGTDLYKHQFNTSNIFSVDPVDQGKTYYYLLRPVSIYNVRTPLSNAVSLSKTVEGYSGSPPSLQYLDSVATSNGVTLFSSKIDFPEIECYQFRLGSQWQGGLFLSNKRSPQEAYNNIKPGLHSFTANTLSTNGNYGNDPQSTSVNVPVPTGLSLSDSFNDDYITDPGTFNNTEHTTYASDDYLKSSHSGSLSGSYISNEFDSGSIESYYAYVDADVATTGAGTTWEDVIPSSGPPPSATTWNDINISTTSWNEIFSVSEAGTVSIQILYSNNSGGPYSVLDNAEILAGVVEGRYFKVKIVIIDPGDNIYSLVENYTLNLYT